jgi:hypothetical protein
MLQWIAPFSVVTLLILSSPNLNAQVGYKELVPAGPDSPPVVPGESPWGAGIKLASQILSWLSDEGLAANVKAKIDSLQSQVDAQMPSVGGGVLVVVTIQQWATPDINGNVARSLVNGFVAGSAGSPELALKNYLNSDRLEPGPPDGWVLRHIYFWKPSPGRMQLGEPQGSAVPE